MSNQQQQTTTEQKKRAQQRGVILLGLNWGRDKDPRIPLGHASLLAALKQHDNIQIHSLLFEVNRRVSLDEIIFSIEEHTRSSPSGLWDLAIGVYVWGEEIVQSLLPCLRKRGFQGRIILGGPQISYSGGGLEARYPDADIFVRGYGEEALCQLISSGETLQIEGVHCAGSPDFAKQAKVDLEALPSPWTEEAARSQLSRFLRWETQRGCPYRCSFCQHREPGEHRKRLQLDRKRIFHEIELFCQLRIQEIAVLDPIFNISKDATEILQAFADKAFSGRLSLQCRAELITEEFLDAAAKLDVKLEFGLQTIHETEGKAIQRKNDIVKVEKALNSVREREVNHEISLIFGLPEQTLQSFYASVAWCLKQRVPVIKAFPLMLLRGTALDAERKRWSLKEDHGTMPVVIQSNTFTQQDWQKMAALSEALKETEGQHPTELTTLLRMASDLKSSEERWRPSRRVSRT